LIWLVLVAVVFVAGGTWFVAKSMKTRAVVLAAGVMAAAGYLLLGKPSMHDAPLSSRLVGLVAKAEKTPDQLTAPEVLAVLEDRARKSPRDPQPHTAIGALYAANGRPNEAMMSYNAALRRDPNYKPALYGVSELEFRSSGVVDQGTLDRLPEIREIARTSPESLTSVQLMALLEERARTAPDDPMSYRIMGQILQGVGQVDKAEAAYGEALKRNPKDLEVLKGLADMKFKSTGKVDAATAELYHRAYGLDHTDLRVGYMAGIGDWVAGRKEEAEKLWAEIDAKTPKDGPYPQMFAALRQMFGVDAPPPGAPAAPNKPG
jgi:cytochrome c-type biogenesis protein CcmH/NrfG